MGLDLDGSLWAQCFDTDTGLFVTAHITDPTSDHPVTSLSVAPNLGADFAVDSSKADWPAEVRKLTDKRGVDLVVEHIGGVVLQSVFHCLARGGTVVTCGATGGREVPMMQVQQSW